MRPWGILAVGIDVTDETTTALVDVYTNRSKANRNRQINESQSDYVLILIFLFTLTLKKDILTFRIPMSK